MRFYILIACLDIFVEIVYVILQNKVESEGRMIWVVFRHYCTEQEDE